MSKEKGSYYRPALFGCLGSLIGGAILACLMAWLIFRVGLPQGHGSGSDIANGFIIFLIPMLAFIGAIVGAVLGALIGFIINLTHRR